MTSWAGGSAWPGARSVGLEDLHPGAARRQQRRRRPAVGAVVAFAGHDHDRLAIDATEQTGRLVGHRSAGPADEHLDSLGSLAVDARHLLGA